MKEEQLRQPVVAGQFYEGSAARLTRAVREAVGGFKPPSDLGALVGGVVPHAGWVFSGPTAAKVFVTLAERAAPATYVLLGAVHQHGVSKASVYASGWWNSPLGPIAVNETLASAILEEAGELVISSAAAHEGEHSIEVQVPFILALSPGATIVPIAVPPSDEAAKVGEAIAAVIGREKTAAVVVASTDLTHYGMGYGLTFRGAPEDAMPWMRENDRRVIQLALDLKAEQIVPEAEEHYNACGAGALAAAVAAARVLGARRGRLLEYITSADVMKEEYADRAVGYAGIVFEK